MGSDLSELDDLGTRIAATRARMAAPAGPLHEPDPAIPYERERMDPELFRAMAVAIGVSRGLQLVDERPWVRYPAAFLAVIVYLRLSRWWRSR